MIARDELEELRRRLADPARVCALLGLRKRSRRQAGGLLVLCPWHEEKTASCSVTRGADGTLRVNCFSCGGGGDVLSLVAAVRGLDVDRDFKQVVEETSELAGAARSGEAPKERSADAPVEERAPVPALTAGSFDAMMAPLAHLGRLDDAPNAADVTAYLTKRGLLAEACKDGWFALPPAGEAQDAWIRMLRDVIDAADLERAGLVMDRGFVWPEHRLCIPWRGPDGVVTTLQRRRLDDARPKYVFPKGRQPAHPYGVERVAPARGSGVAFVEGAVDVLAVRRLYAAKCLPRVGVGVPGLSAWRRSWAELARGRLGFVAFDADAAGDACVDRVARDLRGAGALDVFRLTPRGGKDWAELVTPRPEAP